MEGSKSRLGINAWAICVFFFALAGIGIRNVIGWYGYFILVGVLLAIGVVLLITKGSKQFHWYRLSKPLSLFLLFASLSTIWSAYRFETFLACIVLFATTLAALCIAALLSWTEILDTFATALRYLLGISLVFELYVAVIVQRPLLQRFVDLSHFAKPLGPAKPSVLLEWSRAELLHGGPIQGFIANSALLGFAALLALIVFGIQLWAGRVGRFAGIFWVGIAAVVLVLTRAATVTIAVLAVVVALLLALWARKRGEERRGVVYVVGTSILLLVLALSMFGRPYVTMLLGKSSDLTGRFEIWDKVTALAQERPVFGWGWISHWAPWVEPFKHLDTKVGLPVMHAHNVWLDIWLQLGFIGLTIFLLLTWMTLQRVWCRAVDAPRRGASAPLPHTVTTLFPWLMMIALMVQSLSESRLLIESGWLLFALFAIKTRTDYELPFEDSSLKTQLWKKTPKISYQKEHV